MLPENTLLDQLLQALRSIPGAEVELIGGRDEWHDLIVEMKISDGPVRLLIEAKKNLYPRDAREAVWRIRESRTDEAAVHAPSIHELPLLVADSISSGAKEVLQSLRVGYFDGGGSLYVPAPGAYVYVDRPPAKTHARVMRSLFTGSRARVIHVLLHRHTDWMAGKDLAEAAKVSPGTASEVLVELERLDWAESRGKGPHKQRRLKVPGQVLDSWVIQAAATAKPSGSRYFVSAPTTEALLLRLDEVFTAQKAQYAISYEAAAQRYAPYASSISRVRCWVNADKQTDAALAALDAKSVGEGANLIIMRGVPIAGFLFRERLGEVWLASSIQVYLDLMRAEGRAVEMAGHLRRERIGF